jgi:hypothetical protein
MPDNFFVDIPADSGGGGGLPTTGGTLTGPLLFSPDGTVDIGSPDAGATLLEPRNIYVADGVFISPNGVSGSVPTLQVGDLQIQTNYNTDQTATLSLLSEPSLKVNIPVVIFSSQITATTVSTTNLWLGNSAPATTPGSVVNKVEVFDASGTSLGFVAIYASIT